MTFRRAVRVLLADDHVMVRDGLARLINEQPDMQVVAETADGLDAVRLARTHAPDVALIDVSMSGWDGATLAQELARTSPQVRILAVTRHEEGALVRKMLDAGAIGYVLKQSASSELIRAVRTVAEGRQYLDPSVRLRHSAPASPGTTERSQAQGGEPLTNTEEAVLRRVASAWTHRRIAEELGVEVDEVFRLRESAAQKAGLATRLQIVHYARARGWP